MTINFCKSDNHQHQKFKILPWDRLVVPVAKSHGHAPRFKFRTSKNDDMFGSYHNSAPLFFRKRSFLKNLFEKLPRPNYLNDIFKKEAIKVQNRVARDHENLQKYARYIEALNAHDFNENRNNNF